MPERGSIEELLHRRRGLEERGQPQTEEKRDESSNDAGGEVQERTGGLSAFQEAGRFHHQSWKATVPATVPGTKGTGYHLFAAW